jgi:outer membrane lipoprotein-sorting protein
MKPQRGHSENGQAEGVNVGTIFARHPVVRWVLPIGVVGVIIAATSGAFAAQAADPLPDRTPQQLLADIAGARIDGLQGTISQKADLGLPALPAAISGLDAGGSSLLSLLSGSHTARVWYGGPTKQRVALLSSLGETDVFRNGTQVWQWDSSTKTATSSTLPSGTSALPQHTVTDPAQLAKKLIADLDPNTVLTTDSSHKIADRPVYELVFSPKPPTDTTAAASRIGSVWIAIDAATKIPVAVQVYAKGRTAPAIDVSFTSIYFGVPEADNFTFTPPVNATVVKQQPQSASSDASGSADPTVIGSGWTSVVEVSGTSADLTKAGPVLNALAKVSGTWGSGRLLDSRLLSALITSDGRIFAGPVDPQVLYDAAASHK